MIPVFQFIMKSDTCSCCMIQKKDPPRPSLLVCFACCNGNIPVYFKHMLWGIYACIPVIPFLMQLHICENTGIHYISKMLCTCRFTTTGFHYDNYDHEKKN